MENLTLRARNIKARSIAARSEKLNGKTPNGKADGLRYLPNGHRKPHPKRPNNWDGFQATKLAGGAEDLLQDRRFQRDVERLHGLGARAIYELLAEIGRARLCRLDIETRTARYAQLEPATVRAVNGDLFPPPPIHKVA